MTVEDFTPVPGSNQHVFIDYRSRTYRVESVKPYDAGAFTSVMAPIAQSVVALFQSSTQRVYKVETVYDSANDKEVTKLVSERTIRVTPPVPYDTHEVDGSSILVTDTKVYVAGRDLDADGDDSLYEFQLRR